MKGRAFYQELERSLVHRLVVDGLLFERVDRLVVHRVYRLVLDRVDVLVIDRLIVDQLLVERWLDNRLIVELVKQQKDSYIPRP